MSRSDAEPTAFDDPARTRRDGVDVLGEAVTLYLCAPTHERSEIRAFADLVGGLLDAAGPNRRRAVSLALAPRPDTPPEIARRLANDSIDIAEPMIVHSPVLTSSDLVEIMRRGRDHVRCVGRRLDLAPDIAAVLIDSSMSSPVPPPARSANRRRSDRPVAPPAPPAASDATAPADRLPPPLFKVPVRETPGSVVEAAAPAEPTASPTPAEGNRMDHRLPDGPTFLDLDSAGRWRALQAAALEAATASPRLRPYDVGLVGDRLLTAVVARDRSFLVETMAETLGLAPGFVEAVLDEASGEVLAILLLACGVGSIRATSILLHHFGEAATLGMLQDLAALLERTPRRTAERLVSGWRDESARRRTTTVRQTDPAERRDPVGARETTATRGLRSVAKTGSD